jgi:hypothetical protein
MDDYESSYVRWLRGAHLPEDYQALDAEYDAEIEAARRRLEKED